MMVDGATQDRLDSLFASIDAKANRRHRLVTWSLDEELIYADDPGEDFENPTCGQ